MLEKILDKSKHAGKDSWTSRFMLEKIPGNHNGCSWLLVWMLSEGYGSYLFENFNGKGPVGNRLWIAEEVSMRHEF